MIFTLAKLGLLMLSYLGYWEFFRRKLGINVYFVPAFTLAVQFTVMFIPGLLNFLGEAAFLVYFLGFVALACALRQEGLGFLKHYVKPGFAVFFVMFGIIALAVRGAKYESIDNFTHWGNVVQNMLWTDQFPSFSHSNLMFAHYPVGTSALVYYFCKFVGANEDMHMLAQAFVMLNMFLPVFAYAKRNWILSTAVAAVMLNFLFSYNIYITDLRVDTVLPMTAGAMMLFWYSECAQKQERCIVGSWSMERLWLLFPLLFLTMNMKTSGLLFVVFVLLIALVKEHKSGRSLKPLLTVALFLMIGFFLWNRHCDYVTVSADDGPHAVSINHYKRVLKGKSFDDVKMIIEMSVRYALMRKELAWILGTIAVLGGGTWLCGENQKGQYKKLLIVMGILHGLYWVGLVGTYIFSMERWEALAMLSFDRYIKQADIIVYITLTAYVVSLISDIERIGKRLCTGIMALAMVFGTWKYTTNLLTVFQMKKDAQGRQQVEKILEEYGVEPGWNYLVCDKDSNAEYAAWVVRYILNSPHAKGMNVTKREQLEDAEKYQYIIVLDQENPYVQEYISQNHPEQAGEWVIQSF